MDLEFDYFRIKNSGKDDNVKIGPLLYYFAAIYKFITATTVLSVNPLIIGFLIVGPAVLSNRYGI